MGVEMKTCTVCGEEKPLDAFNRTKEAQSGRRGACRVCENARRNRKRAKIKVREYTLNNAEKIREIRRRSRQRHPETTAAINHRRRAAAKAGGSYTAKEWRLLCAAFDNCCLFCGEHRWTSPDHVIPLSKGGTNDISNLQPLCRRCNERKNAATLDLRDPDVLNGVLAILKHNAPATALLGAYQNCLDTICGPEHWSSTLTLTDRGAVCSLTIFGVTKSATGDYPLGSSDENPATSAESQAFKRACSAFGLGRYLYALPQVWGAYDQKSKQLVDPAHIVAQMYQALPKESE
jgi:5-methylcytosine-specific restriction endonuclease McrA